MDATEVIEPNDHIGSRKSCIIKVKMILGVFYVKLRQKAPNIMNLAPGAKWQNAGAIHLQKALFWRQSAGPGSSGYVVMSRLFWPSAHA